MLDGGFLAMERRYLDPDVKYCGIYGEFEEVEEVDAEEAAEDGI